MVSFRLCLNTSTLSNPFLGERPVDLVEAIEVAAAAGFDGIEVWMRDVHAHVNDGGDLDALRRRVDDLGLRVENGIGFAEWIVDDDQTRHAALESVRRDMAALVTLGCGRLAAPPAGAVEAPEIDVDAVARRFDALCDVGVEVGVVPQLELWGFSANMSRVSDVIAVLDAAGRPTSPVLLDAYHLIKGGSGLGAVASFVDRTLEVFHVNDLPAGIERGDLVDADRVLPGEGDLDLASAVRELGGRTGEIVMSLELFDRRLWNSDPTVVAGRSIDALRTLLESTVHPGSE